MKLTRQICSQRHADLSMTDPVKPDLPDPFFDPVQLVDADVYADVYANVDADWDDDVDHDAMMTSSLTRSKTRPGQRSMPSPVNGQWPAPSTVNARPGQR